MRAKTSVLLAAALALAPAIGGCGGGRVRLEMGGLNEGHVSAVAENAAEMQCELRRGLLRVALRCPGIAHPEERVDMVVYANGRVECVARRDHEDDCPLVAEALVAPR